MCVHCSNSEMYINYKRKKKLYYTHMTLSVQIEIEGALLLMRFIE